MKRFAGDPYRNFLLAIIERAVKDCKRKHKLVSKGKGWKDELLTDPEYYLFENPSEDYPSFLSICAILHYPPNKLRSEIKVYLGTQNKRDKLSTNSEKIEERIREYGIVQRFQMTRYARDSLRLNSKELDKVIDDLVHCGAIGVEKRLTKNDRWATYYLWKGYREDVW